MTPEQAEELICDCGAGHGSLEGHVEWCKWLRIEPNIALMKAAATFLRTPAIHRLTVGGKRLTARQVADRMLG